MPLDELDLLLEETIKRRPSSGLSLPLPKGRFSLQSSLKRKDLRLFAQGLARLLQGGVPLLRSLEIIGKEFKKSSFQVALIQIKESIQQGRSLSEALKECSSFPSYFIQMVEAGELSGNLDKVLQSLAEHLEREEERRRKTKEALAYPSLVLLCGLFTLIVLLEVVIPKIALVYEDLGGELPGMTQAILILSRFLLPLTLGSSVLIALFFFAFRKKKEILLPYFLKLPFLGNFVKRTFLTQFSSLLSLMLQSGIPILQAIESVGRTFGKGIDKDFSHILESLSQGKALSQSLEGISWCGESTLALILSGEESGKLPEVLEQISKETQKEIESQAHFLLKLLEPSLILGIGIIVGFIVVSTILPILEMNELVR